MKRFISLLSITVILSVSLTSGAALAAKTKFFSLNNQICAALVSDVAAKAKAWQNNPGKYTYAAYNNAYTYTKKVCPQYSAQLNAIDVDRVTNFNY